MDRRNLKDLCKGVERGAFEFNFSKGNEIVYPKEIFTLKEWEEAKTEWLKVGNSVYVGWHFEEGESDQYYVGHSFYGDECADSVSCQDITKEQFDKNVEFYEQYPEIDYEFTDYDVLDGIKG